MRQSDKLRKFRRLLGSGGLGGLIEEQHEHEEHHFRADTLRKSARARTDLVEHSAALAKESIIGELRGCDPTSEEDHARAALEKTCEFDAEAEPALACLAEELPREPADRTLRMRVPSFHDLGLAITNAIERGDDRVSEAAAVARQVFASPSEALYELCLRYGYEYIHPVKTQSPAAIYQTATDFYDANGEPTFTFATTSGLLVPRERLGDKEFARQFGLPQRAQGGKDHHRETNFTHGILGREHLTAPRYYQFALDTTAKALHDGYLLAEAHEKGSAYIEYATARLAESFTLKELEISAVDGFPLRKRLITRLRPGFALLSMRGLARKRIQHGIVISASDLDRTPLKLNDIVNVKAVLGDLAAMVVPHIFNVGNVEADVASGAVLLALRTGEQITKKIVGESAYMRARGDIRSVQQAYEAEPHRVLKRKGHVLREQHARNHADEWITRLLAYAVDPATALPKSL